MSRCFGGNGTLCDKTWQPFILQFTALTHPPHLNHIGAVCALLHSTEQVLIWQVSACIGNGVNCGKESLQLLCGCREPERTGRDVCLCRADYPCAVPAVEQAFPRTPRVLTDKGPWQALFVETRFRLNMDTAAVFCRLGKQGDAWGSRPRWWMWMQGESHPHSCRWDQWTAFLDLERWDAIR